MSDPVVSSEEVPAAAPRVSLFYPPETDGHVGLVFDLWPMLHACGVDAVLDPPAAKRREDWPLRVRQELARADFVLVTASAEYRARAESAGATDPTAVPVSGSGVDEVRRVEVEAAQVRELLLGDPAKWFDRVPPGLLPRGGPEEVPGWLSTSSFFPRVQRVDVAGCEGLLRLLYWAGDAGDGRV